MSQGPHSPSSRPYSRPALTTVHPGKEHPMILRRNRRRPDDSEEALKSAHERRQNTRALHDEMQEVGEKFRILGRGKKFTGQLERAMQRRHTSIMARSLSLSGEDALIVPSLASTP